MFNKNIKIFLVIFLIVSLIFLGSSCEKEVSTSPPLEDPPDGYLFVASEPSGAAIYLNDRNTGHFSPDSLTFLDEGDYVITLKKKYYKDTTIALTLAGAKRESVYVDYLSNPSMYGSIKFNSQPNNAEIIYNDSLLNKRTPFTLINILPGIKKIIFRLNNHVDDTINVIVESSREASAYSILQDTSVWIKYNKVTSSLPSNFLNYVAVDNNNIKWFASQDAGLISFDGKIFTNYTPANSQIPTNNILTISIDDQDRKWLGTDSGLVIFDDFSWTIYNRYNSLLPSNRVEDIEFENGNIAWIGTSAGLAEFNSGVWKNYTLNNSNIPWVWIYSISIDHQNNKWLGLNDSVIVKFDGQTFSSYYSGDLNISSNIVSSSAVDVNGEIWFGHYPEQSQTGISIFNGSGWESLLLGSTLNRVEDIKIEQGNKWISTSEGLVKIIGKSVADVYRVSNSGIIADQVTSTAIDKNGILWITTFSGMNKFKF